VLFQRFTLDKIHHQVPTPCIHKMVIDVRQIGVHEIGKHECIAFESFNCFLAVHVILQWLAAPSKGCSSHTLLTQKLG